MIQILKIIVLTLMRLNFRCILAIMSSERNRKRKNKGKERKGNSEEKSEICMMGIFRLSLVTDSCIYCSALC